MKDNQKLILGIFFVIFLYLLNYITVSYNIIYLSILVGFLIYIVQLFGFRKNNLRYQKDLLFNIIICVLSYFLITYLSAMFFGFRKNVFQLSLDTFTTFIISVLLTGVITEIIRYLLLRRYQNSTKAIVLFSIFFVFIDLLPQIVLKDFTKLDTLLGVLGLTALPTIFDNILFCYLSLKVGYRANIFYRVVMRGYIYFVPLIPNFNDYLFSIIKIIFPIIILLIISNQFQDKRLVQVRRKSRTRKLLILPILFLIIVVSLVSGYFKYFALTIGSMSMSPSIEKGDILIIEKTKNLSKISEGEILAFNYGGEIVVHRIINKIIKEDQTIYFKTQGDYNKTADNHLVTSEEVIGIARLKIKYLGLPTVWLNEALK